MCRTITVFSTKGGVGKTLIASNLAVGLGHFSGKKVAIVDLDLQAVGDMAKFFNAPMNKSFQELLNGVKNNPQGLPVRDYLIKLEEYGVDFLPAVQNIRQVSHIDGPKVKAVLNCLEKEYDYIIIDAGKNFTESLFETFNLSNLILLVVTPDILSVYQTKWSLDLLQSMHIPLGLVKVVLNRSQSLGGVIWQEVRAAIPCDIISRIPSEGKHAGLALNRGVPVIIDAPTCKASVAIRELEKLILEDKGIFMERHDFSARPSGSEGILQKEGALWDKLNLADAPSLADGQDKDSDEVSELKKRIYHKLIEKLDLKYTEIDTNDKVKMAQLREKTERIISSALAEETGAFITSFEIRKKLVKEITDEVLGLGPLEDLLADSEVSDIMVNNKNQIYIERHGKIELTTKRFLSNEQVRQVIERIIAPLGRRIDESVPMVDARLADGSRVNAVIPPLTLTGPTLTIRKFGRERLTAEDLLRINTMNAQMYDFLKASIAVRKNSIISGGTGSGKTTVLNVLSAFIPSSERIITIEDAAEIKLNQEHWVRMESRPPNIEGKGAITVRDLFRNSLRMRPDRIIIGECRGAEALDMLQAMNTGHDGSMTTIHANSTYDVLARLDSMILMSGVELPIRAIREMIASAIDVIIHTARLPDGTRKIMEISEVTGLQDDLRVGMQSIFAYKQTGIDSQGKAIGNFEATGYVPTFMQEIKMKGIQIPDNLFSKPK